jgi:Tol biopolymer transport system component
MVMRGHRITGFIGQKKGLAMIALGTRIVLASALAILAALAMLSTSGTAEAAFPGTNGKIAFQSSRHVASGEIYTITPGGTATRTTFSNGSADPAYSPDGSKIAFVSDTQIFVMNADGSGRRQVTISPTAKTDPSWSADGTRIAYVSNSFDVDGQTDLEIWAIKAGPSSPATPSRTLNPPGPRWETESPS